MASLVKSPYNINYNSAKMTDDDLVDRLDEDYFINVIYNNFELISITESQFFNYNDVIIKNKKTNINAHFIISIADDYEYEINENCDYLVFCIRYLLSQDSMYFYLFDTEKNADNLNVFQVIKLKKNIDMFHHWIDDNDFISYLDDINAKPISVKYARPPLTKNKSYNRGLRHGNKNKNNN